MHRALYIIVGLTLLFTSCNNRQAEQSALSSADTERISLFLVNAYNATNADSVLSWTNKAYNLSVELKQPRWVAKTQLAFSAIYRRKHDTARGIDSLRKAIAGIEKFGTRCDLADALVEQVHYSDVPDFTDYADSTIVTQISMMEQASRLFSQEGDSIKYAAALCKLGFLYNMRPVESITKIMDTLKKALALYHGDNGSQYAYNAMAMQYAKDGSYPQAIDFGIKGVNAADKFNDSSLDAEQIYDNLGRYYYNQKQFGQSIPYFQKALVVATKNDDSTGMLDLAQGLISCHYLNKDYEKAINMLAETERKYKVSYPDALIPITGIALICFSTTGKYDLAKPYLAKLLQYSARHNKLDQSQAYVYTYLIEYYLDTKQYAEAEKYCMLTDTFSHYYKIPRVIASNYDWWSEADSALGHFEAAFYHFKEATKIRDTFFGDENRKQLAELKIKYETEKKEQNIVLLTKQSHLQEATIQNTKLTRNVMLGAAGMLTLMLGLGFNRYRLKQRTNKRLELKQQEINEKNESLQQLLNEKEWLIKEIHHRVKNNLQIVISLLSTQSMYLENEAALKAITESQSRMHAMSLIHQKLYQSDNVSTVSMQEYIRELINYLRDCYNTTSSVLFEQGPDINLDVAQAIPVGLILNEAITNAIKYAFSAGECGTINVSIEKNESDTITLTIADNGVGLPGDYDVKKSKSLGMSLMKGLAEQLGGTFTIQNKKGLVLQIIFPYFKEVYSIQNA